jgi:hypothetical protein
MIGNFSNEYILKLQKEVGIFSTATLSLPISIDDFIGKRKVTIVHSHSMIGDDGKKVYQEKIYKTTQGFYIYLVREDELMFNLTIYYKQEQSNEFDLFIGQLLKQFKQL